MNVRRGLVAVALVAAFAAPRPTLASCAAPSVGTMPDERRAGQLVLLMVEGWTSACDDTGGTCAGCGDCSVDEPDVNEIERVVVELSRPGMDPIRLVSFETAETTTYVEEIRLPRDLEPGRYRVRASGYPVGGHASSRLVIVR